MSRPRLLDLFSGAGGAAMGYHRAGFDVVGVDIKPQPHYPFEFHQADALEFLSETRASGFDVIHASPPCQAYTLMANRNRKDHPRLIEPIRAAVKAIGLPYVIENVIGAPVRPDIRLCGFSFDLRVHRHRIFETDELVFSMPFTCHGWRDHVGVYGDHPDGGRLWTRKDGHAPLRRAASVEEGRQAMGIDWMDWRELAEAIPPAYTEWIGRQLINVLERVA